MTIFKVKVQGQILGYIIEKMYIGLKESHVADLIEKYNIKTIATLKNVVENEFGQFAYVRATKPRNL